VQRLDILKVTKTLLIYMVLFHISVWGAWSFVWGD